MEECRMYKEDSPHVFIEAQRQSRAESPKVSILVLTYNHERYIEQALEGALRQRTQFDFELVIADDCSHDRTPDLVKAFVQSYPRQCRVLPREKNLGLCKNFADAYSACRGEYVAILEGDDIWHEPHKLQCLADILDDRSDCSFVFHNVKLLFEDGREQASCCPPSVKSELSLLDFVADNFVPNCSAIMFRNKLVRRFPDWFLRLSYYDWPLHILHLQHGLALYLSEPLSTYRIHGASAWHGATKSHQLAGLLDIFHEINRHLGFQYDSILRLNGNFRKLQSENEQLRCRLQEVEKQQRNLEGSRCYKIVRTLARVKRFVQPFDLRKRVA